MPRIRSRRLVWAFFAYLALWVFSGHGQEAGARLAYQGTFGSAENEDGRLIQNHGQRLTLDTGHDLFGRLTSEEYVNYNYGWAQESGARESISPGATLRLSGDIFAASLGVNSNKNLLPEKSQTDRLGLLWASRWEKEFVPRLRANYDYTRQRSYSLNARGDNNRKTIATHFDWDLRVAQLFYSYGQTENNYAMYQETGTSHLARVDASRGWLDNRLRVSGGYDYKKSVNKQRFSFTNGTTANVLLALPQADTGTDILPTDNDDSMLVAAPFLLNGADPLLPPAYIATAANNSNCIRLRTDGQQVDRIFLYTQTNLGPLPTPLGVNLRVYSNNNILINSWDQVVGATWVYDSSNQRFIIDLPAVRANYVKLVVDLTVPVTINFTEVQAEQVVQGTLESTVTYSREKQTDRSNFGIDFQLNNKVAFFYGLILQQEGKGTFNSSESESHNAGVRMQNSGGDVRSMLAYSRSTQRDQSSSEVLSESYNLSFNKIILPTLSVSLTGTHEGSFIDGAKTYARNRYSFYSDATLYPDLTSRLETVYSEMTTYGAGTASGREDLEAKFALTSRFTPTLNVSAYDNYMVQNQIDQDSKWQNNIGLASNWQVSDLLSLYVSMTRNSNSTVSYTSSTYSTGLVAGYGSGFELQISYSVQVSINKSQSGRASLRWSTVPNLSWEIGCNYAEADTASVLNVYRFYTQASVNFAAL